MDNDIIANAMAEAKEIDALANDNDVVTNTEEGSSESSLDIENLQQREAELQMQKMHKRKSKYGGDITADSLLNQAKEQQELSKYLGQSQQQMDYREADHENRHNHPGGKEEAPGDEHLNKIQSLLRGGVRGGV